MAPQQDPANTSDNNYESKPQTVNDVTPPQSAETSFSQPVTTDNNLTVDNNGFVPEPAPVAASETDSKAINEQEPFASQLAPAPVEPTPKKKGSKKKLALIIGGAVAAVLLGAGGVFAFWYNTGDKSVEDAFSRMLTASSLTAKGSIAVDSPDTDVTWAFDAAINDTALSVDSDVDVKVGATSTAVKGNVVVSKNAFAIKMENFGDLANTFLTASGMPAEYLSMYDGLIAKIDNKWVVITTDDIGEATGDDQADKEIACVLDTFKSYRSNKTQQNEVRDVYAKNRFMVVSDSKGTETIDGKLSNRYELTFDEVKAEAFGKALVTTDVFKQIDDCTDNDLAKEFTENSTTTDTEETATGKLELWVDVITHDPTRVKVSAKEGDTSTTIDATIKLNNATNITVPTAETTFKDLQTEIENIQMQMFGDPSLYEDAVLEDTSVLGISDIL